MKGWKERDELGLGKGRVTGYQAGEDEVLR